MGADWAWARRLSRAHVARVRRFGIGASYPRTPPWMGRVAGGPKTEERANPLREFDRFLLQNGFKIAHLDSPASEADLPRHREDSSEPRESRSARNPTHHSWQKHAANLQNSGRTSRGVRGSAREERLPGRRQLCHYLRDFRLRNSPKHWSHENRESNCAAICGKCGSGARQTGPHARAGGKSDQI